MVEEGRTLRERVYAILNDQSNAWTDGEKSLVAWQWSAIAQAGSTHAALWNLIQALDEPSLDRLALAYPNEVGAYRAWRDPFSGLPGGLRYRLEVAGVSD